MLNLSFKYSLHILINYKFYRLWKCFMLELLLFLFFSSLRIFYFETYFSNFHSQVSFFLLMVFSQLHALFSSSVSAACVFIGIGLPTETWAINHELHPFRKLAVFTPITFDSQ